MKKTKYGLFLAALVTLTGCAGIGELYKDGEFHTAVFEDNYYRYMPARYTSGTYHETIYDISDTVRIDQPFTNIFNPIILRDYRKGVLSFTDMLENYGNEAAKNIKREDNNNNELGYVDAVMTELNRSSSASWYNYALYNNLSAGNFGESVNSAFKKGVFSKLTDGIILCNGGASLVRIQIDEDGIGQEFAHELIDYRNFVFSARGGTNVDYWAINKTRPTVSTVRINISFYIEKSTTNPLGRKETLTFVTNKLQTDNSGTSSVFSVDLREVLPLETLKRTSGITINYELLAHDVLKPDGVPSSTDGEFALMLYEVMFPYSVWR